MEGEKEREERERERECEREQERVRDRVDKWSGMRINEIENSARNDKNVLCVCLFVFRVGPLGKTFLIMVTLSKPSL